MGEPQAIHLTIRDYEVLPDDGNRYEIIDGRLEVTPAPSFRHQSVSRDLLVSLVNWVRPRRLGEVFAAPADVQLAFDAIVQPDLLFISSERSSILGPQRCKGAPDLVVEIFSHASALRDTEVKRSLYARHGVREYWLVDLDLEQIVVLTLSETGYEELVRVGEGGAVSSSVLSGLSIPWSEVFRKD